MFSSAKNSKKQGDIGLGAAIGWLTSRGATVCIPLTDSQDYDLIADLGDRLLRVQVKTTRAISKGTSNYCVTLRVCGGNRSASSIKPFDPHSVDYVFVLTEAGARYFIPAAVISAKHSLVLGKKWEQYRVQ